MSQIKKILDVADEIVYPVTHERAVRDDSGTTLESKLEIIEESKLDFTKTQSLNASQKAQALSNVGISGIDNYPTKNSDNLVKSGGVYSAITSSIGEFDLTEYMSGTTYASLTAALAAMSSVPSEYKKGGMSLKYVQSSDNKYVQYIYNGASVTGTPNPFLDTTNWEKVNLQNEVNTKVFTTDYNANKVIRKLFIDTSEYIGDKSLDGLYVHDLYRNVSSQWGLNIYNSNGDRIVTPLMSAENAKQSVATGIGIYLYVEYNWENMLSGGTLTNIKLTNEVFNTNNDDRGSVTQSMLAADAKVEVVTNQTTGKTELKIGGNTKLIVDKEPEIDSTNLVESGAVLRRIVGEPYQLTIKTSASYIFFLIPMIEGTIIRYRVECDDSLLTTKYAFLTPAAGSSSAIFVNNSVSANTTYEYIVKAEDVELNRRLFQLYFIGSQQQNAKIIVQTNGNWVNEVTYDEPCYPGSLIDKDILNKALINGNCTDDYYITNNNVLTPLPGVNVSVTGYIPVSGGKILKFHYINAATGEFGGNAMGCFYDENQEFICSIVSTRMSGEYFRIPYTAKYIRINAITNSLQNYAVVCPNTIVPHICKGKTINVIGDSLTYGSTMPYPTTQRFGAILGQFIEATVNAYGAGGTTVAYNAGVDPNRSMVKRISTMDTSADVVILFGGVNDFWSTLYGDIVSGVQVNIPIGNITDSPATPEEATTFCGGLNYIFNYVRTNYAGKPMLYICAHQQVSTHNNVYYTTDDATPLDGKTYLDYVNAAKQVCARRGVPMLDLYKDSGFDVVHNDVSKNIFTTDGAHYSVKGNYYIAKKVAKFIEKYANFV